MGDRPLRQFYDHEVRMDVSVPATEFIGPWRRHRERFAAEMAELTESQWRSTTRCTEWDAVDVINHLVTADGFWIVSITGARLGSATSFLHGFDPSTSPGDVAASLRDDPIPDVLARFEAATANFIETVESLEPEQWEVAAESPVGHVPAALALAHAFWDSWLHERDILIPLDLAPDIRADEVEVAAWYSLFVAGLQGGLIADPAPVGPGPAKAIDTTISFSDLDGASYRVRVAQGVQVDRLAESGIADATVNAVDLVEGFTGRYRLSSDIDLPEDLRAHMGRAGQIL